MLIAGTSFLLETMQYILAVGRSDITDVLTNTAGGLLGLAVYSTWIHLLPISKQKKAKQANHDNTYYACQNGKQSVCFYSISD